MDEAPENVGRIVWTVLRSGMANCIRLEPEPLENVKKLLRDGQKAAAAVRDLLRDYASDVRVAPVDADCRFYARALYVMRPEVREGSVVKQMYVKFSLVVDPDDESLSDLRVIRFHPSTGHESITRFPRR